MAGQLVERLGNEDGRIYPLGPLTTTIGRAADNDVVLSNQQVSRYHAKVCWDGARYVLHDLDSRNGSYLNGQRVTTQRPLAPGDELLLAGSLFLFRSDETTAWVADVGTLPPLRLDLVTAQVWLGGQRVQLTAQEYRVLSVLYDQRSSLVRKEALIAQVWPDFPGDVADDNLAQLISRLRRKLEPDPKHPHYLETVRGLGYRLVVP